MRPHTVLVGDSHTIDIQSTLGRSPVRSCRPAPKVASYHTPILRTTQVCLGKSFEWYAQQSIPRTVLEVPFCVSRQISRIRKEKSNGAFEGPAWQGVGIFHRDSRLYLVQSPFFLPHWKKKAAQVVTLHSYTRTDIQSQLEGDTKRVHSAASGTVCIPETRFLYVCVVSFDRDR